METKRRVLLIAYYFPPFGMGGVQRAAKLAKYLPCFGWDVTVLTVKDIVYYQRDESLLEDVRSADIQRTGSLDPLRLAYIVSRRKQKSGAGSHNSTRAKLFRFLERRLFIPDSKKLWIPFAYFRGLQIIKRQNIKAIFSTAPPFSSHLLAYLLSSSSRLPWTADFRDGWTNNDFLPKRRMLYRSLHGSLEKLVIKNADKVAGISRNIVNFLQELEPQEKKKFTVVYNGFDDEDFEPIEDEFKKFRVTMLGTVTEWADPSVFIPAIRRAAESNPDLKKNIDIQIIGNILHAAFRNALNHSGIKDFFTVTGYLPHKEAVKRLVQSHLLLFPVTKYDSPGIITGKLYEYLASGVPILAHAPPGEARDILKNYGEDTFLDDGKNEDNTADFILKQFVLWQEQTEMKHAAAPKAEPYKNDKLQAFSRKNQAKTIAGMLNEITGSAPAKVEQGRSER